MERRAVRWADVETDRWVNGQIDEQTHRWERQTHKWMDRQMDMGGRIDR